MATQINFNVIQKQSLMKYPAHLALVLIVSLLVVNPVLSQKVQRYLDGYIITESKDTISGKISTSIDEKINHKIRIKKAEGQEEEIDVEDITLLQYNDGITFKKITIKEDHFLAKCIVTGGVDLYNHRTPGANEYLIKNKNRILVLSPINVENVSDESTNAKSSSKEITISKTELDTNVTKIYENCTDKIRVTYKLRTKFLRAHIKDVNDCLDKEFKIYPTSRIIRELSLIGGYTIKDRASLNVPYTFSLIYSSSFPNFSNKFSLYSRMNFIKLKPEDNENEWILPLIAGIRYKFLTKIIQPYIAVGTGVALLKEETNKSSLNFFPFDLGIGADIPLNYNFSIKADFSLSTLFSTSVGIVYVMRTVK